MRTKCAALWSAAARRRFPAARLDGLQRMVGRLMGSPGGASSRAEEKRRRAAALQTGFVEELQLINKY